MQGVKIGDPISFPDSRHPDRVTPSRPSRTTVPADRVSPVSDEARLSLDRGKIEKLTADLLRLPEIRQERVETLSQAIRQGRYQVADEQIAEALASELLEHPGLDK